MRRLFLTAAVLLAAAAPSTAAARAPVTHPYDHAWLYATRMAQAGAEWMFPHASDPFGQVTRGRDCTLQENGSYECWLNLAIYSTGHWTGRRPPSSVEHWACDGPIYVTVRRVRSGAITTSAIDNPCRPPKAPDEQAARLRFVAMVHHRSPRIGRVGALGCRFDVDDAGAAFFACAASAGQSTVYGHVDAFGAVTFGAPPAPTPLAPSEPSSVDAPG